MSGSKANDTWERFMTDEQIRIHKNKKEYPNSERRYENQDGVLHLSHGSAPRKDIEGKEYKGQEKTDDRQIIVIESKAGVADGNQSCCPGQGARRIIIMIVIYAVAVTVIGSFLAHLSLGIPSLNKQIAALNEIKANLQQHILNLTAQVDELTYQVDRLDNGTRYLSVLNDSLNQTVKALNRTVMSYADENNRLNASNIVFQQENKKLNLTVAQNEVLILNLNQEIVQLNTNITSLNNTMLSLDSTLKVANETIGTLNATLQTQQSLNQQLQNTTVNLSSQLNDTKVVVAQLSSVNNDLSRIINYLNNTGKLGMSFDAIRSELASQILNNQVLLYNDIHSNYDDKLSNIPCNFGKAFAAQSWMTNMSKPIGSTDYVKVKSYLNGYYFSPVCANYSDFEKFLLLDPGFGYNGTTNATVNVLNAAMNTYFGQLLLYYFPVSGYSGSGLTLNDWITANFTCLSLPVAKKFMYK